MDYTTVGTVMIIAEYEDLICTAMLYLRIEGSGTELFMLPVEDETYRVSFSAANVESFDSRTFTLTYDPGVLELTDLCAFTYAKELTAGEIPRTGITILTVSSGTITFEVDKDIAQDKKWSGMIDIFVFTALDTDSTEISIT